jgi:anti-anti-sigma factor
MKLRLVRIEPDGIVHIASQGDITLRHVQPGENGANILSNLLGENWTECRVLLDLSETAFIDSAGVGWLIDSHKQLTKGGGRLAIHSPRQAVRRVLEMLHVDRLIATANDAEAGRTLLRSGESK